jgi:hypothetical protein
MAASFDSFLNESVRLLKKSQDAFLNKFPIVIDENSSWYYDQPSGVIRFSREDHEIYFAFQSIGSFSPKAGTWLWSWASQSTYSNVKSASFNIR